MWADRLDLSEALEGGGHLRRPAAVGGVGVAAEHMDQARGCKRHHPLDKALAQEEVGSGLNQRAGGDQLADALVHVGGYVPLGVGDQRPVAALGEVFDPVQQSLGERPGRRLQQHPASTPERDPPQLLLAQVLDHGLRDLPALQHRDRNPLLAEPAIDRLDPARQLLDADVVIVADMGRGANRLDAVDGRLASEAGAVADVERAVVNSGKDVAVQVDHEVSERKTYFSGRPQQARGYDDRHDPAPAVAGLRGWIGFNSMNKKTTRRGNYESGSDYVLEYGELRFAFNEEDFGQRVEQAAVKLGFVQQGLSREELDDLLDLAVNGEISEPASLLGEHINENWEDLVGPSNRSLVHWLRRLVFRGAWLDQRVKEGELDVVFDDTTQTFGYVQPDRSNELIELSKEPSWRRIAYRR